MSDFVSCPTCSGRGVVPLETAETIAAHAQVNASEAERAQKERDRQMVEANYRRRGAAAEERQRHLEGLVYGRPNVPAPEPGDEGGSTK